MPSSLVFWDVDTQFDFMHPAGKLYVPGAETIISNLHVHTWTTTGSPQAKPLTTASPHPEVIHPGHLFCFVNVSLETLIARCGHTFRFTSVTKAALLCGLLASG